MLIFSKDIAGDQYNYLQYKQKKYNGKQVYIPKQAKNQCKLM